MFKRINLSLLVMVMLIGIPIQYVNADSDASNNTSMQSSSNTDDVTYDEYNNNVKDLKKISYKQLKEIYDNGQAIYIYIGRPSCPHCRAFSPVIKELNIMKGYQLYYYNTDGEDFDASAHDLVYNKIGIPGVPTILCIKNKAIISGWVGGGITATELNNRLVGVDTNNNHENSNETDSSSAATSGNETDSSSAATSGNETDSSSAATSGNETDSSSAATSGNETDSSSAATSGNETKSSSLTHKTLKPIDNSLKVSLPKTGKYLKNKMIFPYSTFLSCIIGLLLIYKKI